MKKIVMITLLFIMTACTALPSHAASLTVAAAANMSSALTEIGKLFEKKTGITPVLSFGSSGILAKQIENGAPFDVFVAADRSFVEELEAKGLILPDSVKPYAIGRIGITTKRGSGIVIRSLQDLAAPSVKKIAIANPGHAPYGRAAKEALKAAGLWETLKPKLVYGENIRQTFQFVSTGNADAGITALSLNDPKTMEFVLIDASLHKPLVQAMGIVSSSQDKSAAKAFEDLLLGNEVGQILKKYGYELPEN